jgi:hypothetical protein
MIIPGQCGFNCPSGFREEAFWNMDHNPFTWCSSYWNPKLMLWLWVPFIARCTWYIMWWSMVYSTNKTGHDNPNTKPLTVPHMTIWVKWGKKFNFIYIKIHTNGICT